MSSETDSNSSSSVSLSEQERKRKKIHKKLKKKSEKKHKKEKKRNSRKEKKRSRNDARSSVDEYNLKAQEVILSQKKFEDNITTNDDIDIFGPALPPHLLNKNRKVEEVQPLVIGPIIPNKLLENLEHSGSQNLPEKDGFHEIHGKSNNYDDLQGSYGPLPVTNEHDMTPAQVELEQRALELKMAAIDGTYASKSDRHVREEWMLELPNVGLKSGLAALNNLKRGFHQGKEKPDFSDRSSWTKTPNSCQEKQNPIRSKEEMKITAQALYEKQRDAEQEAIAKKHKKKHKREESLVELHQKKLRAEERKKAKQLKEAGAKPERRPFTRDVDLKLNKIDRNQTKQIVDKAKILNTKFSSGHSKYL